MQKNNTKPIDSNFATNTINLAHNKNISYTKYRFQLTCLQTCAYSGANGATFPFLRFLTLPPDEMLLPSDSPTTGAGVEPALTETYIYVVSIWFYNHN